MFATAVRASRRAMFGCVVGAIFLLMAVLAIKDMNDKLTLMTVSNANYQKMTDSLTSKIRDLETEVKNAKQGHKWDIDSFDKERKESVAKSAKLEDKMKTMESVNKQLKKDMEAVKAKHEAEMNQAEDHINKLERANQDLQHAKGVREKELREQLRETSLDNDRCQSQYEALYKQFMASGAQKEEPLPTQAVKKTSPSSSAKPQQVRQLQMPAVAVGGEPAAAVVAASNSLGLSSSTQAAGAVVEQPAPVPANEVVPAHVQSGHVDVLEAPAMPAAGPARVLPLQQPKALLGESVRHRGAGVNLDQEVDQDSQDHPELSRMAMDAAAAVDKDFLQQEVENEQDDNVDGVISNPRREHQLGNGLGGQEVEVLGVNKEYDANETGLDDDSLFNDHQDMGAVMANNPLPRRHHVQNVGVGGAGQWRQHQPALVQPQQQYYIQAPHQFNPRFGGRGL